MGQAIAMALAILVTGCYDTSKEAATSYGSGAVKSSYDLLKRILPDRSDQILFEEIDAGPRQMDRYEITGSGGKIIIRGTTGVAMASGLYAYLKKHYPVQISVNQHQLNLPEKLSIPEGNTGVESPFEYRYLFNYCTYGYSMPWWDWDRWERMIDYMALQGVNMPLAIIGQEAVWQEVLLELGMSDSQIAEFFVGPAHLPWGWMGNIDGLGGPLPENWITRRAELQKKILGRMRSLGMKPVLQGFTGHVPVALKAIFPEANIFQIEDWAGIPGTHFLDPTDPLFQKIGKLFIEKQTELFGTDHLYDADCFIEVDPPSKDPAFLKTVSTAVYQSMASADPEAIWVIQGWFFFFKKDFWQPEQGRAFLGAIPENKAIVLDLYGEKNPTWKQTEAFYGLPWIWNVICNEDQKINMSGDLAAMQENFREAWRNETSNNLRGIGVIPEGIGFNPVVQEFIFEKSWNTDSVYIPDWIADYAYKRYGSKHPKALQAWDGFQKTVYGRTRTMWSPLITTPRLRELDKTREDIRHVRNDFEISESDPFVWDFDMYEFHNAAQDLLAASDELNQVGTYRFDLTHTYRELLQGFSHRFIGEISAAYADREIEALKAARQKLLKLFDDLEAITGTNENFLLGTWLEQARSWGDTPEEKAYYEWNARTIISIWQPWKEGGLRDYAGKAWNGMFSGYYKPRWKLLTDMLVRSLETDTPFDPKAFDSAVRELDYNWTRSNDTYPTMPTGDVVAVASRIEREYAAYFRN